MSERQCLQLEIGWRTDVGRVRSNNEDTCQVLPALKLFVISDGMGGQSHGELASSIAGDTIAQYCAEDSDATSTYYGEVLRRDLAEKTNRLANAVRLANRRIYQTAIENPLLRGMGATVVAAWLEGFRLSLVHVGDSRAYLLRFGVLRHLTSDHTLVAEQIKSGLIKPEEARLSKMQNVLIRALGIEEQVELDAAEWTLLENDVVLFCTDGLTRMVSDLEIANTLTQSAEPQISADNLVSLANERGGEDNVSVIVLHIAGVS